MIKKRSLIPLAKRSEASRIIAENVMARPEWERAKTVCIYISLPEEVDTSLLVGEAMMSRKVVCVPKIARGKKTLRLFRIHTFDDLTPGRFGIFEPKDYCTEVPVAAVDVFIVPGVAFDYGNYRVGWGKGYYDTLLNGIRAPKIGLAYECQIVPRLIRTKYDIPMDVVITEKNVYG